MFSKGSFWTQVKLCLRGVEFNVVKVFALLAAIQESPVSGINKKADIATRNLLYWIGKRLVGINVFLRFPRPFFDLLVLMFDEGWQRALQSQTTCEVGGLPASVDYDKLTGLGLDALEAVGLKCQLNPIRYIQYYSILFNLDQFSRCGVAYSQLLYNAMSHCLSLCSYLDLFYPHEICNTIWSLGARLWCWLVIFVARILREIWQHRGSGAKCHRHLLQVSQVSQVSENLVSRSGYSDSLIVSGWNFQKSGLSWILHGSFDIIRYHSISFDIIRYHSIIPRIVRSWFSCSFVVIRCQDAVVMIDPGTQRRDKGSVRGTRLETTKARPWRWESKVQNHDISSNRFW